MKKEIINYIVKGGENLNDTLAKTPGFPKEAENLFASFWRNIATNSSDDAPAAYVELPFDGNFRLHIRSFWQKKAGNRALCYYVGFLIPRSFYDVEYYCVSEGLSEIKLDSILSAMDASAPILVETGYPLPRSVIGKDLRGTKLYGVREYKKNLQEMWLSVSVNEIERWFKSLYIAVNPSRLRPEYTEEGVIVSAKRPESSYSNQNRTQEKPRTCDSESSAAIPMGRSFMSTLCNKKTGIVVGVALFIVGVIVGVIADRALVLEKCRAELKGYHEKVKEQESRINRLDAECFTLRETIESLRKEIERLRKENEDLKKRQENRLP